jgi:hypothetical protein
MRNEQHLCTLSRPRVCGLVRRSSRLLQLPQAALVAASSHLAGSRQPLQSLIGRFPTWLGALAVVAVRVSFDHLVPAGRSIGRQDSLSSSAPPRRLSRRRTNGRVSLFLATAVLEMLVASAF